MPSGDAYILLNPAPRDKRGPGISDFEVERQPDKANHYDYKEARRRFGYALPMYSEEAEDVRQRIADGQLKDANLGWMAEKPMYPAQVRDPKDDRRQPVLIRHYLPDGSIEDYQGKHSRTNQRLWAPGNQPVVISAHDALRLGLIDWMIWKRPRVNFPEVFEPEGLKRFAPVPPGKEDLWR